MDDKRYEAVDALHAAQCRELVHVFNGQAGFTDALAICFDSFDRVREQYGLGDIGRARGLPDLRPVGPRRPSKVASVANPYWGYHELWAQASYTCFRSAFVDWAAGGTVTSGEMQAALSSRRYDVDHLFARSRAMQHPGAVVRLVLSPRRSNRSWGSVVEKLDRLASTRIRHDARYLHLAKVLGVPAPRTRRGRPDAHGVAAVAAELRRHGVKDVGLTTMEEQIDDMFSAIARRRWPD